jgi:hypothetical protein
MKTLQTQQARELVAALRAIDERALAVQQTTDRTDLDWAPPSGGWSASQVFEHLCVANDSYLDVLRGVIERAPASSEAASAAWRPSLMGGLLTRSMVSPRKLPAPKQWRPSPTPRPNVIAAFMERQREIVALIERSTKSRWQRVRLASPVSSLIRMNVGDAFTILVRHEERHFAQLDRVLAARQASTHGIEPARA